jgi:hypothetical protein
MSYQSEVLADSPLLYVRFEETSGATCANDGSLGGDATASGTYTRDVAGGASGLGVAIALGGGVGDAVTYPHHASLNITGDVTYECWVKIASYAADMGAMMKGLGAGETGSVGGYILRILTSRQLRVVKAGIGTLGTSTGTIPNDSGWHHIAFTRSGNTYTFYIDGADAGSFSSSTTINAVSAAFQIGREWYDGGGRPLSGSIDEAAVYSSALTSTRIQAHYDARNTAAASPPAAAFSATPLTGDAPLTVQFTDESTNTPTAWDWDFGDSGTSTDQHPEHEYTTPGSYDVGLEVTNAGGSDDEVKAGYITVTEPGGPGSEGVEGFSVAFDDPTLEPDPTWTRLA